MPEFLQTLREAIRAVPSVKYALGIVGIVSAIGIIKAFRIDLRVAAFGVIVMIVLMVLLLLFARLSVSAKTHFVAPAKFLLWASVIISVCVAMLLTSSIFFNWPIFLQHWLAGTTER